MKKVFIIGNGFDLHHGLRTSYYDFAQYLKNCNNKLFKTLENYISYPKTHDSLWADFETNLANLNFNEILDDNSMFLPNIRSDEFRTGDLYAFPDTMDNFLRLLTEDLFQEFQDFIQLVKFPDTAFSKMIELDTDATFLTFNYTKTLEELYSVRRDKITYIHNSAFWGAEMIILGHGINPNKFEDELPEPPEDVDPKDYGDWYKNNVPWDYSYDTGKEKLQQYYELTFKPTRKIILDKIDFFESIKDFDEINILGHSLSDIDMPYFQEIYKFSKSNSVWKASYYSSSGQKNSFDALTKLGVKPTQLEWLKLSEIQKNNNQQRLWKDLL